MATFDASSVARANSLGVASFSHTVTGEANRLLVLGASYRAHNNTAAHITAATYNGVAMHFVRRDQAVDRTTEIWWLEAPASGAHTVALTWSADPEASVVGVSSYWGIIQPTPYSRDAGAIGNSTAMSVSIELEKITEVFVEVLATYPNGGANVVTPTSGGVNRYSLNSADLNVAGAFSDSIGWRSPTSPVGFTSVQAFTWACSGVIFQGIEAESYRLLVDWDNDGLFSSADDDISADALSATCARGLDYNSSVFARSIAGTFRAVLDNTSGKYSPFNSASPLAGKLVPGHFVRLYQLTPFYQVLWSGDLVSIVPAASSPWPTAELTAAGVLAGLNVKQISALPQDNVSSGIVVQAILDAAGWPKSTANLVVNPSFETAFAPDWFFGTNMGGAAGVAFDTTKKTDGTRSMQLTGQGGGAGVTWAANDQDIQVPAGQANAGENLTLEYDRWFVSKGTGGWGLDIYVYAYDSTTAPIRSMLLSFLNTTVLDSDWVHVIQPLRALPYWTAFVRIIFQISSTAPTTGTAVANIDNVKVYGTRFPPGGPAPPRNISVGAVTVGRWAIQEKSALEALQEMEETETGYLFEGRFGEVNFEDRYQRATSHPTSVINVSDAADATLTYAEIEEDDAIRRIYNSITAKVQPGHVGALAVLWTQTEVPIALAAGATVEYQAVVSSPNLYATAWTTPVVGTDITQTGVANSDLQIVVVKYAKTMLIYIRNNHATATATLTLVQARGTPMVADAIVGYTGEDANSISAYGRRTFPLPSSWYRSSAFAQSAVDYFLTAFAQPQPAIRVTLGPSLRMAQEAVTREISDRITLAALGPKTMLGIADDFYIDKIEYQIAPFTPIQTTWTLSLASQTSSFWILGVNQLGVDTKLAW